MSALAGSIRLSKVVLFVEDEAASDPDTEARIDDAREDERDGIAVELSVSRRSSNECVDGANVDAPPRRCTRRRLAELRTFARHLADAFVQSFSLTQGRRGSSESSSESSLNFRALISYFSGSLPRAFRRFALQYVSPVMKVRMMHVRTTERTAMIAVRAGGGAVLLTCHPFGSCVAAVWEAVEATSSTTGETVGDAVAQYR